jgi:transcriptional regulator with XRE-family HTH domain
MERLATKSGLSKGMISLIERDLRNPTFYTLLRIARALKLDFGEVIKKAAAQVSRGQGT